MEERKPFLASEHVHPHEDLEFEIPKWVVDVACLVMVGCMTAYIVWSWLDSKRSGQIFRAELKSIVESVGISTVERPVDVS